MIVAMRRLLLGAMLCLSGLLPAHAAVITVNPSATATVVGGSVLVSVDISDLLDDVAPAVGGFDISLSFDPAILNPGAVQFGAGLDVLGLGGNFREVTTGSGVLSVFELSLDTIEDLNSLQPGAFTLFTLTFDAIGAGTSAVSLTVNSLSDAEGAELAATLQDASIAVAPVPLPAAAWLLLSGFGVLGLARRRA